MRREDESIYLTPPWKPTAAGSEAQGCTFGFLPLVASCPTPTVPCRQPRSEPGGRGAFAGGAGGFPRTSEQAHQPICAAIVVRSGNLLMQHFLCPLIYTCDSLLRARKLKRRLGASLWRSLRCDPNLSNWCQIHIHFSSSFCINMG